jgi:hypothetical protein
MADETQQQHRELAYRANDGVDVVLFWHQISNELVVTVSDKRTGAYFEVPAEPHEALDVFNHPYAHAAFGGVPYEDALLASSVATAATERPIVPAWSKPPTR